MQFANPWWLLLLILLGIWTLVQFKFPRQRRFSLAFPDLSLVNNWVKQDFMGEKLMKFLKIMGWFLMIVSLARPQTVQKNKEPPKPVVDIILCLDTSQSMAALDFEPNNRLEAAKKAAEEFIKKRSYDRIGLVVFGGRAITQCPLTLDHQSLIEFLRTVSLNATLTDGTAIGTAIAQSCNRLTESEAKTKIVILLTDGRSNVGNIDPLTAAGAASELGIKIYTIGTAVPGGGMIPYDHPVFGRQLLKMTEDLDESTLLEVARITSAKYFRVTSGKRFKEIYNEIDKMEKTRVEAAVMEQYKDFYPPFLAGSLIFLCLEIFLRSTLYRSIP